MNGIATRREFLSTAAAAGLAVAGALAVVVLATEAPAKLQAAAIGAAIVAAGALLSGNIRLFAIWGFGLTIPFDLSKRFGPIIEKMGGESSFRVEMSDPFLLILAFFVAREILAGRRAGLRVPKVLVLWLAILSMGLMAIVLGPWRTTAAHEVFRMAKLTFLFVVVTNELENPRRILHMTGALTAGVIVQSLAGLLQFARKAHLGLEILGETGAGTLKQLAADSIRTERAFRAGAFLSHPNIFGIFLAMLLPLAVAGFLIRRKRGERLFFLGAISLGMAALVATLSRSGWVSFFVAFCVLMFLMILNQGTRRASILTAIAASFALLLVCIVFADRIITRITESKESAMLSRSEYLQDARGMIAARPLFGWGLNSYVYAAPPFTRYGARGAIVKYQNWLPPVHNIYYLVTAELGVVGLALHLALLAWLIIVGVRNLKVPDPLLYAVNAACLAGIAALLVDGFFSFSLRINSILRVFWTMAALLMAIHYWRIRAAAAQGAGEPAP